MSVKRLMEDGHKLWSVAFKGKRTDAEAHDIIMKRFLHGARSGEQLTTNDIYSLMALGRWIDGACRTLRPISEEFFAALALTDVSRDAYEDIRFPWPAFAVEIPEGALVDDDGVSYRFAIVAALRDVPRLRDGKAVFDWRTVDGVDFISSDVGSLSLYKDDADATTLQRWSPNGIASLMFDEFADGPYEPDGGAHQDRTERDQRIQERAIKAIVGMLYTLQHSTSWSHAKTSKLRSDPRFGPPDHRVMVVGAPIKVDVRAALREYIEKGHTSPKFQSLVRGHRKRQVVGKARSGRKIVWIEPYWRGPKEAPIMARSYEVGR